MFVPHKAYLSIVPKKEIKKNELEISELDWYELLADILYLRDQGYEKEHIFDKD